MKYLRNTFIALAAVVALGGPVWAQMMGRGGMGGPPNIPGIFAPKVGEGAEYQVTTKQGNMDFEMAIVGKDSFEGQDGFWQEVRMKGGKGDGMVMKQFFVSGGENPGIKRMIMQPPGQEPIEMPMSMMGGMMGKQAMQQAGAKTAADMGEMVGTESVTVPAGTFTCQHYKSKSADGGDVWLTSSVSPYGLVKAVTKDSTIVLQKSLSGQTSQIKGEPKKMEMPHF